MIVAAHQPQYMPWLGYFDKIDRADVFVLLDTVQYKKNEWQNRNRIKGAQGWQWLTVPVLYKFPQKINEVGINNKTRWQDVHRKSLQASYAKAPYFKEVMPLLDLVFTREWRFIAQLNAWVVRELAGILGIATPIHLASELPAFPENPDDRLIALTGHFKGATYLAGAGGRDYMNMEKYRDAGIEVEFQAYSHPVYPQRFGPFEPNMSILDLLFNCGPEQSLAVLRGEHEYSCHSAASG